MVFDALLGEKNAECWMLVIAGHQKHYAVVLRLEREPLNEEDTVGYGKPLRWVLETASAAEPLLVSNTRLSDAKPMWWEVHRDARIDRARLEVSQAFAEAVQAAWSAAVRRTRYFHGPPSPVVVRDGNEYLFRCGAEYGETNDGVIAGVPAALVQLAGRLRELVNGTPTERSIISGDCLARAKQIVSDAEASDKNPSVQTEQ